MINHFLNLTRSDEQRKDTKVHIQVHYSTNASLERLALHSHFFNISTWLTQNISFRVDPPRVNSIHMIPNILFLCTELIYKE
jgi:hypothetical protein